MECRLLVEGSDDEHVVKALCGHHQLPRLDIRDCRGKSRLLESFPIQLLGSIDCLGVVLDADQDLEASWMSLKYRLTAAGYRDLPDQPDGDGTIIEPPARTILPRVGLWLMPNNRTPGILEDFLSFLIRDSDPLWPRARAALDSIPSEEIRFDGTKRPKALIHTWLAWQDEPGRPLGQSITRKALDAETPEAMRFVEWLKRLMKA